MISKSEVSELFIVLFGRPTEGEGNTYWVNESRYQYRLRNELFLGRFLV